MVTNTCRTHHTDPVVLRAEKRSGAPHNKKQSEADRPALSKQFKHLSNSRNPSWLVENLDMTRDRKVKSKKKGRGGQKLGNPKLYSYDQKMSRLELQVGEESFLSGFSTFVRGSKFDGISTDMWCIVESILLFMYDITRMRNVLDFFVATVHLFKHYTKENFLTQTHMDQVKRLVDVTALQDCRSSIDDFGKLLGDWKRVESSPLLEKLSKVLIYCSTAGLYKGMIPVDVTGKVGNVYKQFKKRKCNFHTDFLYYTLDLLHFICDKAYGLYFEGKDPKSLFTSNLAYDDWLDKTEEVIIQADYISGSEFKYDVHSYLSTIEELIRVGNEIVKYSCDLDRAVKILARKKVSQLNQVKSRFLANEAAQAMRPEPFGLVIEGDSGVGKSKVISCLTAYFAAVFDKAPDAVYCKNATTQFWDGFCTYMWCLILDDVAMWSSDVDIVDESILDIIRILNTMPLMPNMASLEDKGKTPFRGDLVFVSTNVPDLKFNEYFTYPFAAARRLPFHIRVKPKSTQADSFMIDSSAKLTMGEISNSWYFDILKPVPKTFGNPREDGSKMQQAKLELIHSNIEMPELLRFFHDEATLHRNRQKHMIDHNKSIKKLVICPNCKLPTNFCPCNKLQVGIIETIPHIILSYLITRIFDVLIIPFCSVKVMRWYVHRYKVYFKRRLRGLRDQVVANATQRYSQLECSTYVPIFATILATLLVLYKVFGATREQGGILSSWGSSYEDLNEPESCWKKEPMPVDTFESSAQSLSLKGKPLEHVKDLVRHNLLYLRYRMNGQTYFCRMFNIVGQKCIVPSHCIPYEEDLPCEVLRGCKRSSLNVKFSFKLKQSDVHREGSRDFCIVTIHGMNLGKDMRQYFHKERACNKAPAFYLGIDSSGEVTCEDLYYSEPSTTTYQRSVIPIWRSRGLSTIAGDCGKILCRLDDMGFRILGIHRSIDRNMFTSDEPCAIKLSQEYLRVLSTELDDLSCASPQLGAELNERVELRELSPKSVLRSVDHGCIQIYGNVKGINRPRSKVRETLLCKDMLELGYDLKYTAPDMTSTRPWKIALKNLVQADLKADWDVLQRLRGDLLQRWSKTPKYFRDEIKILDMHTVINGKAGVRYIDPIPRKTSAGFPWCKPKNLFMSPCDEDDPFGDQIIDDKIMEKVEWRLNEYRQGRVTRPVFRGSLKDEATSLKKASIGKTRVFMGAPVDFTIAVRSVLLSFVRVVQKNKFIFESAPGTEAQSSEWHDWSTYLTQHGKDRLIFGDFSGFDSTMRADFMLAAFQVIEDFHRLCGATEEHCRMIKAIGHDITFPIVEFNGDLIQLFGKNPSGQPLTVIINGIVGSLYMRYVFIIIRPPPLSYSDTCKVMAAQEVGLLEDYVVEPSDDELTFDTCVVLVTYGDDNGMGVSKRAPWFNHTTITTAMAELGVVYTMADKQSLSRPYVTLEEADFLKRKWRFEEDLGKYVCPLNEDSIFKSLMIGIKSVAVCKQEHAASIIISANDEFFWHGREKFELWHERLKGFVVKHNLEMYLPCQMKNWDELCDAYRKRSQML